MAKDLKVGDRVRVYGSSQTGWISFNQGDEFKDGIVIRVYDCYVQVEVGKGVDATFHPKQCRRLKPKVKKVDKPPKEVWVNWYQPDDGDGGGRLFSKEEKADSSWAVSGRIGNRAWRYIRAKVQS